MAMRPYFWAGSGFGQEGRLGRACAHAPLQTCRLDVDWGRREGPPSELPEKQQTPPRWATGFGVRTVVFVLRLDLGLQLPTEQACDTDQARPKEGE